MTVSEIREYVCNYMEFNDINVSMLARRAKMPVETVRRMVKKGEHAGLHNWERLLNAIGARLTIEPLKFS